MSCFYSVVSVVLYAIFSSYFAGVMVRLMLTLTPIVCVCAAIAFSKAFEIYLKDDTPKTATKPLDEAQENKADNKYYDKVRLRNSSSGLNNCNTTLKFNQNNIGRIKLYLKWFIGHINIDI